MIVHWSKRISNVKTVMQMSNTGEDVIIDKGNNKYN